MIHGEYEIKSVHIQQLWVQKPRIHTPFHPFFCQHKMQPLILSKRGEKFLIYFFTQSIMWYIMLGAITISTLGNRQENSTHKFEVASKHVTFIVSSMVKRLVKFTWRLIKVGVRKKKKGLQDFCMVTLCK
jgi:hypothetical protein